MLLCISLVGGSMGRFGWQGIGGRFLWIGFLRGLVLAWRSWLMIAARLLYRLSRDVAIKFLLSDRDKDGDEGSVLRRLNEGPEEYPGKRYIVELLDQFEVSGPNGHHQCLVTEALGPWVLRGFNHEPLSPGQSWEVAKQLVEATVYMHSLNIVHGSECFLDFSSIRGYYGL